MGLTESDISDLSTATLRKLFIEYCKDNKEALDSLNKYKIEQEIEQKEIRAVKLSPKNIRICKRTKRNY
jgi:hypothetical protein